MLDTTQTTNATLYARREAAIPRGVGHTHQIFIDRGENAEIWDVEGKRYIDFAGGIAVLNTGHRHPQIMEAVQAQMQRFTHTCFQVLAYESYVELAERLNDKAPGDFAKKTVLLSTGAEAVENAVKIARQYFRVINMEIYPVNSEDYKYLHECGADYVTVFQETYNSDKYATLHLAGHKRIFPYRFYSQERAILGGMRGVGFAALLGLDDYQKDALATGMHAWLMQRKYPHAEISLSCPRLCPIINNDKINPKDVDERKLTQIICAYRLFMPYANIVVSSRESASFRNAIMKISATKVSASVCVGIGGHLHQDGSEMGDEQFEITDGRSFDQMYADIKNMGLQPLTSEYIYL